MAALRSASVPIAAALALGAGWLARPADAPSPIRFACQPIAFTLDSCETPERHAPETMAGGVAVFDYDNDGALDIFFTNGADIHSLKKTAPKYWNRLFHNDGKGHFTDVTQKAGLAGTGYDTGVAIGDYDNDGYEDIFVGGVHRNTLYHNNGDGTFTDVTAKAGLNQPDAEYGPLWSVGAAWVDLNNDGLLDLVVVNYLSWNVDTEPACPENGHREYCHPKMYKPTPNQIYLNNGDGTFRDVSAASGVRAHPGKGMGIGVADYDLDGNMDFFISNDKMYNWLFHNLGNGKFEEVAFPAGVALRENAELISGMGLDFRDLFNTGRPDIALAALDDETFPLFRNTGQGEFSDATGPSRMAALSMPMAGYSPTIFDFDNDGWKDIFVSRGHVQSPLAAPRVQVEQPNTVFRNLGNGAFAALTAEAGLDGATPAAASRIGGGRSGWRRAAGCGGERHRRAGRDLDEPQPGKQPLAGIAPGGHAEQSRRHRRQNQGGHQDRDAIQPRDHRLRLRLLQRRPGALRAGRGGLGGPGGDPLAIRPGAAVEERARRPAGSRQGAVAVGRGQPQPG